MYLDIDYTYLDTTVSQELRFEILAVEEMGVLYSETVLGGCEMGMMGFWIYESSNDTVNEEGNSLFPMILFGTEMTEVDQILAGTALVMHNVR